MFPMDSMLQPGKRKFKVLKTLVWHSSRKPRSGIYNLKKMKKKTIIYDEQVQNKKPKDEQAQERTDCGTNTVR